MITTILTLFSSGAFGSLVGLIGGYFNRKLDIQAKKLEYEHDLNKMDKDLLYMKAEYEERTKIATIETEGKTEVAGYNAMSESYAYAPITGDSWTDRFSKLIRPMITAAFFFFSVYIFYQVSKYVTVESFSQEGLVKLYTTCIEWVLFQAGVSIGWWFAMRPGKVSK
jgi:hypothetical protein